MRNGDFIAVGTVDFTDEEMSLIKNIFDSICFYPYKSDNKYKGEKVTTTLSYMLPYVPFFLVYHDYQCICSGLHLFWIGYLNLDDIPTLIKVTYCYDCGKILKKEYFDNYNYFNYSQHLSNEYEIKEFYKRCKIAYRNEVTLYDNKLRKNYYGQI
ncbi:MAG: hypothetical protein [Bacteriophage sp.]|nr:MAG: hypothetical protein [Bacteriophage sp.]